MEFVDYDTIHQIVETTPGAFWDGWTAIFVDERRDGYTNPRGRYVNGKWVVTFRAELNDNGQWKVPAKYARRISSSRN